MNDPTVNEAFLQYILGRMQSLAVPYGVKFQALADVVDIGTNYEADVLNFYCTSYKYNRSLMLKHLEDFVRMSCEKESTVISELRLERYTVFWFFKSTRLFIQTAKLLKLVA